MGIITLGTITGSIIAAIYHDLSPFSVGYAVGACVSVTLMYCMHFITKD